MCIRDRAVLYPGCCSALPTHPQAPPDGAPGWGSTNPVPRLAELEDELEERCNNLGIGPLGLGGRITVMDVFVEEFPAHIASLPVAVNIQCNSARHKEVVL